MNHVLVTQLWIPLPREELFPFFSKAGNLERITPAELRFRLLPPVPAEIGQGTRIRYRLRLWGVPFGWETLISHWDPPNAFVDEQVEGPYRRWVHRHEFISRGRGTLVYDRVDYALPLSLAGELAHPLVRRQLERIFRHRHRALQRLYAPEDRREAPILIDMAPAWARRGVTEAPGPGAELRRRPEDEGWAVKLLYDGACPFCRREVRWLKGRDKRGRLALVDISDPGFDASRYGLDQEEVEGVIHAILPDGRIVTEMEVFRRLYAQVGLGWLLAPTGWPLLRPLFDRAYRLFARYRRRLGQGGRHACDTHCGAGS